MLGEFTAGSFGHTDPVIRSAVIAALDRGVDLAGHTVAEAELARLMCERFPSIALVRFTNSGTEANVMAFAAATAFTGRRRILVFQGGDHGAVLSFVRGRSGINVLHDFIPLDLQRHRRDRAAHRDARRRARGDSRRAHARIRWLHPRGSTIPRGAPPGRIGMRSRADRRRGDDVACVFGCGSDRSCSGRHGALPMTLGADSAAAVGDSVQCTLPMLFLHPSGTSTSAQRERAPVYAPFTP
jgi:hypothetical protein